MSHTVQDLLQQLTTLIQGRFESAQERAQATENERMSRYYKGQADTLRLVLHDIDALKFEIGMELTLEETIPEPPIQEASPDSSVKSDKPVKRKGRAPKPKTVEAPVFTYKALAQKAVQHDIITRKISHFYHDLLPGGHVKGYDALYQAFEDSEELREAIKKALESPPQKEAQAETPQQQEQASVEVPPSDPHDPQQEQPQND